MLANPPADQPDRLQDLRELDVLDTAPEQEFDDVVCLASRICGMPISLISLVDEEQQWFKAKTGFEADRTPIESAICAHTILEEDYLEIPDTRTDPRTQDNPLVVGDDNVRFYAGAVLRSTKGHAVGTLCVLDNKPNHLTDLQRETLRVLAKQVMAQLELRRALKEAELLRREVDHRVKNSLQSVAAMTRIQSRSATSQETRDALDLTRRRLDTVALLHEHLYAPNAQGHVAMEHFIPRVAALMEQSAPDGIRITSTVTPLSLASPRAAAVGVILNEFAANSFKHAFPEQQSGEIAFSIAPKDEAHVVLTCSDTGRGMPAEQVETGRLGLTIIDASAQQLGGLAETTSGPTGTTTRIIIPLQDARV